MADRDIILEAALILTELFDKPREQIHFTPEALPILDLLQKRGFVRQCIIYPNLIDQVIWSITDLGLHWLVRHGLKS